MTGAEQRLTLDRFELTAGPETVGPDWSADLGTRFRAEQAGPHTVTLEFSGRATLYADGRPLVSGFREASPMVIGPYYVLHAVLDLVAGQEVELRVEYATSVAISVPGLPVGPHLVLGVAGPGDELNRAVALAAESDVAVVLAGRLSGEAMDVESLQLLRPAAGGSRGGGRSQPAYGAGHPERQPGHLVGCGSGSLAARLVPRRAVR